MREWAEHTRLKVEIEYEEQGLSRAKEAHGSRAHYTGERLLLCWFPASKVEPLFHPCLVKLLNESSEERVRRVWISRERRIYARWRTAMFNLRLNEESLSFFSFFVIPFVTFVFVRRRTIFNLCGSLETRWSMDKKIIGSRDIDIKLSRDSIKHSSVFDSIVFVFFLTLFGWCSLGKHRW